MPTLKERIENHPVVIFGSVLVVGFVAGYGVHSALSTSPLFGSAPKVDWQMVARGSGWMPNNECPALPVVLDITSPGSNAMIEYDHGSLLTDVVVRSSRPLPESESVGLVVAELNGNYNVIFPSFSVNPTRTIFREDTWASAPISGDAKKSVNIWAFAIDDRSQIGSHYGGLDEIKAISPNLFLSPSVTVYIRPGR